MFQIQPHEIEKAKDILAGIAAGEEITMLSLATKMPCTLTRGRYLWNELVKLGHIIDPNNTQIGRIDI